MSVLNPMRLDQRRHVRRKLDAPYTDIRVRRMGQGFAMLEGHAYDISLGGIRIELDDPLLAGEFVDMEVRLPKMHETPIRVAGRIVRFCDPGEVGPIRMGVMFNEFHTAEDRARLARHLGVRDDEDAFNLATAA